MLRLLLSSLLLLTTTAQAQIAPTSPTPRSWRRTSSSRLFFQAHFKPSYVKKLLPFLLCMLLVGNATAQTWQSAKTQAREKQ